VVEISQVEVPCNGEVGYEPPPVVPLPPPDGPEALRLLRVFAELDLRDGAVPRDQFFQTNPGRYFETAMAGLQVVVRSHLAELDSIPRRDLLTRVSLQVLLEVKARELEAGASDVMSRDYWQAYALRQFARFLRDSWGEGTSGGT
jgi:hypothetical protein